MIKQTCCFTGHRNIPAEKIPEIKKHLEEKIENLIFQGVIFFGCGGALGFDTIAALTVLDLKKIHPQIKLILVLPCKQQTKGWEKKDIKIYNHIRDEADKVVYTSENYYNGCMQKRNHSLTMCSHSHR